EVLQVREEAAQAQADAARTIELKHRLADRLHATLRATYAELARLDDQLGIEQADAARTIELKQRLGDRLHAALRAIYAEAARLGSDAAQAAATADALRAEVLQFREEAAQAQADAARTTELKQHLADRLHAALRATYAESARLDDQLGTEQTNRARM